MLELALGKRKSLEILCLGAHCDDIDIGCGGTLLKLLATHRGSRVTWVAFASNPERAAELEASAAKFLRGAAKFRVLTHQFRDGYFPALFGQIKDTFEGFKRL